MILITQVNETINQDDEPIQEIKGIANGAEVSFILTRYAAEDYGIHLKAGDVWLYQLNPKQEIHWMTMLWTKDNSHQFTQSYDLNKSVLNYGSLYICHGTEITDKNGENIAIRVLGNEVGFSLYGANIMLYDARSGKVSQITAGQIPKNDQIGRKQSVFLYAYSQRCRYVVIVRE